MVFGFEHSTKHDSPCSAYMDQTVWSAAICGSSQACRVFVTDENSNLNTQVMDIKLCLICICTMRTDVVQIYH